MKPVFKTTILIASISIVVMCSKSVKTELLKRYNNGIAFLSSQTISEPNIIGF